MYLVKAWGPQWFLRYKGFKNLLSKGMPPLVHDFKLSKGAKFKLYCQNNYSV